MGKYIVNCPQCNQSLEVQDKWTNMQTQCPTCNANFIIPLREIKPQSPVCPTPVQQNFQKWNKPVLIAIGILVFGITSAVVIGGGTSVLNRALKWQLFSRSRKKNFYSVLQNSRLSFKGEIAKDYINNLPAEQRNAILYGEGSPEDRADAIASLMKSGNLEGAAEYLSK